jgi:hypothetical protein
MKSNFKYMEGNMPQRKIEDAFKTEELLQGIPSVSLSHQK